MELLFVISLLAGPVVGWIVWSSINKKYRNPGARYAPEYTAGQQVFDLQHDDHFRRRFTTSATQVADRNDNDPTIPAAFFNAVKK